MCLCLCSCEVALAPTCTRHRRRKDIKEAKHVAEEEEPPAKKQKKDTEKPATKSNLAAIVKRDENLEGPPWWHTKATEFKITHCAEPLRAYIQGKVNGSWKQFAEAARDFCFF